MLLSGRGALQQPTNPGRCIGATTSSVIPRNGSSALQVGSLSPAPAP